MTTWEYLFKHRGSKQVHFPHRLLNFFSLFKYIQLHSRSALSVILRQYSIVPRNYYYICQVFYKKEVRHVIVNKTHLWVKGEQTNNELSQESTVGTSLVAHWLRVRLPVRGTRVWALVREDPTCRRATRPVRHSYWACTLEPASHNCWACMPQLPRLMSLEPMLCNKRSHRNEKPAHRNKEGSPLTSTRESPSAAMKTQHSQK